MPAEGDMTISLSRTRRNARRREADIAEEAFMTRRKPLRVGAGAGTSDDRLVPALELAERGDVDYLVFECLAERTVARENLARTKNPDLGYSPSLNERLRMVLPACTEHGIRIVTNMGAANPVDGARAARDLGLGDIPVAVVATAPRGRSPMRCACAWPAAPPTAAPPARSASRCAPCICTARAAPAAPASPACATCSPSSRCCCRAVSSI